MCFINYSSCGGGVFVCVCEREREIPTLCAWWWCPGSWAVWSEPKAAPQWGWAMGWAAGSPCCYWWNCCTNPGCSVWLENTQENAGLLNVFAANRRVPLTARPTKSPIHGSEVEHESLQVMVAVGINNFTCIIHLFYAQRLLFQFSTLYRC